MGLLTSAITKRSLSFPDQESAWKFLLDAWGGNPSKAGPRVNEVNAEAISAWWCGVRVLAEGVAMLPLVLYRRMPNGGRERAVNHPLYKVLHGQWNPFMSPFTGKELVMRHLVGWGNSYHEIQRTRGGQVAALWPLLPDRTHVEVKNGRKMVVTTVQGTPTPLSPENVLHVPGPGFDGFSGKSVVRLARESLGLTVATEEFGASLFGNGASPSGVLEHPSRLGPEAHKRLKDDFEARTTGLANAHRPLILEEGMKFSPFSIPPEDAQFLGTRKHQVTEVARWLVLPPHKIKDMERTTFTNIESENISFITESLMAWMVRIEEQCSQSLLTEREREQYFIEFLPEGLLRGDSTARAAYYQARFNMGTISRNEIRMKENDNPIEGGDDFYVPLNMIPADMAGVSQDVAPQEDNARKVFTEQRQMTTRKRQRDAHMPVFRSTFQNILNRELTAGRRAVKAAFGERTIDDFREWVETFYETFGQTVSDKLLPVLTTYSRSMLAAVSEEVGLEDTPESDQFVKDFAKRLGVRWTSSSRKQLRDLLKKHEADPEALQSALTDRFDHWEETRAEQQARNEVVRAGEALTVLAYGAAGVVSIRWVVAGGGCPLCEQFNGRVVSMSETFASQGDTINPAEGGTPLHVNSSIGHPPLHRGCDCAIVPG